MTYFLKKIGELSTKCSNFENEAHTILSKYESANRSRVVQLDASFKRLDGLSVKQDALLRETLKCIEHGFYRPSIILSWIAFMDFVLDHIFTNGNQNLIAAKPTWEYTSKEQMTEKETDYNIIEVLPSLGLCNRTQKKALHGLLNKRNECSHPSDYSPDINEALGYVTEIFKRIEAIKNK